MAFATYEELVEAGILTDPDVKEKLQKEKIQNEA